ncbi:F-box protein At2g16450 [Brassica rapa]|uniref:F-box protein At2g16450 n=1 Tax=Brassica campestris TaxID=3711 RepID=UPI00142D1EF3|nr:F-box protein At2g16450 [Brassica rapa]
MSLTSSFGDGGFDLGNGMYEEFKTDSARFRSVSKLWASILDSPYFKDLYLTKSLAQPRLIFAIEENGLIYFYGVWTDEERAPVICNPKTGRYETLPYISRTLGTRGMRWRKIGCSLRVEIESEGVCINGVLYYLGYM